MQSSDRSAADMLFMPCGKCSEIVGSPTLTIQQWHFGASATDGPADVQLLEVISAAWQAKQA